MLLTLAGGAFVVGTAELVVIGILRLVADDVGVSVPSAGQLVTAYALGISIGGPVLTALTIRVARRKVLLITLALYGLTNLAAVLATSFGVLLLSRVLTGSLHGLFVGLASAIAAGLVPAHRRGQAVAMVFGGIAVATVVGVPLGTLVGQQFGWRAAFVGIVTLSAVALVFAALLIPSTGGSGSGGLRAQARAAFAPRVLAVLGVGLLILGGQFTAFTYLSPYLEEVSGVSGGAISLFLLAFGAASAVGTVLGGRAADRNAERTLLLGNVLVVAALGALYLVGESPVAAALALIAWGAVGFGLVPALQLRIITLAGRGGDLAATLGASAVNLGIAAGAFVGGRAVASDGVGTAVLLGMIICAVAVPATWATRVLRVPVNEGDAVGDGALVGLAAEPA